MNNFENLDLFNHFFSRIQHDSPIIIDPKKSNFSLFLQKIKLSHEFWSNADDVYISPLGIENIINTLKERRIVIISGEPECYPDLLKNKSSKQTDPHHSFLKI